ncbi:MAG TPA: HEAT repeat domain-containing protein [Candidatus Angelobacter sp.]|jgi:HEAT repeat protein|nr:HEAT repeat domain-containing protein [Candidatus Angelobacter sp.]
MNSLEHAPTSVNQKSVARRASLLKALKGLLPESEFLTSSELHEKFFALDETSRYSITNSTAAVRNDLVRGLLLEILNRDESPLVRHEAAFALGCVGDESCRVALRRTLIDDESFLVRHEAAMALGELGTTDDLPALNLGLKDGSREVVISCEVALNRILERLSTNGVDSEEPSC